MNQDACRCGSEAVREQAALWFARSREGALAPAEQGEQQRWLAEHPQHQYEFDLLGTLWSAAGQVPRARLEALCQADPVSRLPRRRFIRNALAAGLATLALGLGWAGWQQHQLNYQGQMQTVLGERRQLDLPDGSQLEINGRTQLVVQFSAGQRRIELREGEVMFSVAHDSARPFVVSTGNGTVTVTGTRFDVRKDPAQTRVAVEHGSVRVEGRDASKALLSAGLGSHIDSKGQVAAPYAVDAAALTAWRNGKLVFNDAPLSEVVKEVSRYRQHPLRVAPGKIAALRLSSTFSADDTDALLRALPSILPVAIKAHADGSSEIIAK
ncbi:FecR family protein [Pseudomonas rubra]|uniref:FecR family protein n=1 Tax=Pseudomonas rubra TaxID=2942627 RepID=A0ABT5P4M5_9PSED|nr:FecR family protein [Pseudomonas rubra]MDD1013245.1 FecR family protein [Pseudomonas rubra]MDD1037542.1 FecR family protein [Pseudomonas rubra]MDD1155570.1 FecR family protein [Pseudomonas rubra]